MDDAQSQLVDKLKSANNVLVTVSRNPSVDQLSALLGLTLFLNKQGKHAAAVFSGEVPSTIEFLEPEETIEKTTDSLRDFIIALDKSKADKLRYKVEDNVVRIFITPYKTSITQDDLEFSQGDFNVDVVVALGVQNQTDLDEAITAHGRILHDATIATVTTGGTGELGGINWQDPGVSSLSEMATELVEKLGSSQLDNQIATALLTGIVAETARFSNDKTTSQTMSISAKLMAAGANQQLVASKLEESGQDNGGDLHQATNAPAKTDNGMIEIDHENGEDGSLPTLPAPSDEPPEDDDDSTQPPAGFPTEDTDSSEPPAEAAPETSDDAMGASLSAGGNKRITEPPQLGGMLTANTQTEQLAPAVDPLSLPNNEAPLLNHDDGAGAMPTLPANDSAVRAADEPSTDVATVESTPTTPAPAAEAEPVIQGLTPPPPAWVPPSDNPLGTPATDDTTSPTETLSQLEAAVESPHAEDPTLDSARDLVNEAVAGTAGPAGAYEPVTSLNAQPFGGDLHQDAAAPASDAAAPATPPADATDNAAVPTQPSTGFDDILKSTGATDAPSLPATDAATPQVSDPTAPPPVPPPIPFQFGGPTPPSA